MIISRSVSDFLKIRSNIGKTLSVGFVPTMGALHEGHLSLVKQAKSNCDFTIVSIFVNPRQFNDINDYIKYPKSFEKDIKLLEDVSCDLVFIPDKNDIYRDFDGVDIDLDGIDSVLEGKHRPGHFQGVIDIVGRLFELVKPQKAFFGKKDYQQLLVIKTMTNKMDLDVEIVGCEIVREKSGLAMSSRNTRLTNTQRENAAQINKILNKITVKNILDYNVETLIDHLTNEINKVDNIKTEYVAICEPDTLKSVYSIRNINKIIILVAFFCGNVRLIDNKYLHF